jgi:hypothetical protein
MRVTETGLVPAEPYAGELLSRHARGAEVEVTIFEKPNPAYGRLLWSVVGDVFPSTEWPTADALMTWLKVRQRHIDGFVTMGGGVQVHPRSLTTFEAQELVEFGMASMTVLSTEVVPGLDIDRLLKSRRRTIRSDA